MRLTIPRELITFVLAGMLLVGCSDNSEPPVTPVEEDTEAPTLSISSPSSNETFSDTLIVKLSVSDNVGVTKVTLSIDNGALTRELSSAPWEATIIIASLQDGEHSLEARAYDAAGNASPPAAVTFTKKTGGGTTIPGIKPIVFVHGELAAADSWMPMTSYFRMNGYLQGSLHALDFDFSSGNESGPELGNQVKTFVESVLRETGSDRVDIIAHSKGATAVQYYITRLGGVDKVAHVAFLGGVIDQSLTLNGTLTPDPVKFLTVRSNGQDATQRGNPDVGSMTGADNVQVSDLDHQELLADLKVFKPIFKFFTGESATVNSIPYHGVMTISGKVITYFDNKPVPNATMKIFFSRTTDGARFTGGPGLVTVNADGTFGPAEVNKGVFNFEIEVSAPGYYTTHQYHRPWRDTVMVLRVRMIPQTGGSQRLEAFRSALNWEPGNSIQVVYSPFRAMYSGRDKVFVDNVNVVNDNTCPPPGSNATGSNTMMLVCFDENNDQRSGGGPMANAALNTFGINSYDVYMSTTPIGGVRVVLNNYDIWTRAWRMQNIYSALTISYFEDF